MTDTHHHAALQRAGSALGLEAGDDLHKKVVPAINALKAHNQVLRALCAHALAKSDHDDMEGMIEAMKLAIRLTPEEVLANLEAEFDELTLRQATPTMEMIIQAVHDEAGRCDGELTSPIFIRVDPHDYDALCDEERARDAAD